MSVKKALQKVLDSAKRVQEEIEYRENHEERFSAATLVQSLVDQLEVLVLSCSQEDSSSGVAVPSEEEMQKYHRAQIEAAKAEFRKEPVDNEEMLRVVKDGDLEGTAVVTSSDMPVGAKMRLAGKVYELRPDGQLHLADSS